MFFRDTHIFFLDIHSILVNEGCVTVNYLRGTINWLVYVENINVSVLVKSFMYIFLFQIGTIYLLFIFSKIKL